MSGNALEQPSEGADLPRERTNGRTVEEYCDASAEAVLDALGDEYTRAVLEAVLERPRSGREVAEAASVSKATAFRRLNDLVELGLVQVSQQVDPARGHHHKQYEAVVESLSVAIDGGELRVIVETEGADSSRAGSDPARR